MRFLLNRPIRSNFYGVPEINIPTGKPAQELGSFAYPAEYMYVGIETKLALFKWPWNPPF